MLKKLFFCAFLTGNCLYAKELTHAFGLKFGTKLSELKYERYNEILNTAEGYYPPKPMDGIAEYTLQASNGRVLVVNGFHHFSSRETCEQKLEKITKQFEKQYDVVSNRKNMSLFTISRLSIGNGGSIRVKCGKAGSFSITLERLPMLPKIEGGFGLKFGEHIDLKKGTLVSDNILKLYDIPKPKYGLSDYAVSFSTETNEIETIIGSLEMPSLKACSEKQKEIIEQIENDWQVILTGSGTTLGLMNKGQGFYTMCKQNSNDTTLIVSFVSLF